MKKFEKEGVLRFRSIGNIKSYRLNFENEKTANVLDLALIPQLDGRLKYRLEDFEKLKEITKSCILFGSYTDLKKEPNDLDVLFVLGGADFKVYKRRLEEIKSLAPVRIHDMIQTEEDLKTNLQKKNDVIIGILNKGVVLWGQKTIIKAIKDVYKTGKMP